MERIDVISLVDVASRFTKAKGMDNVDYQWARTAPGRSANKDQSVGNSLAVLKALRAFNASNKKPIEVFKVQGYDETPKQMLVIYKSEVLRLKGFLLRGGGRKLAMKRPASAFKFIGKADI